jgi:predicted site-specific integrase-resolvase
VATFPRNGWQLSLEYPQRFGLHLIYHFFEGLGCKIEVIETEPSKDENKELVDDMLALITSFSARLYGKRGGRKKLREELDI